MYVYINAACLTRRTYTRTLKMTRLTRIALIIFFYFIVTSEMNAYQKQIKMISITSEMKSAYIFTVAFFGITYDFSISLMLFNSELQTPITFLSVNENIKCGYSFA